jgi:hypothetical protein
MMARMGSCLRRFVILVYRASPGARRPQQKGHQLRIPFARPRARRRYITQHSRSPLNGGHGYSRQSRSDDGAYQRIARRFIERLASPDGIDVSRHARRDRRAHTAALDAHIAAGFIPRRVSDDRLRARLAAKTETGRSQRDRAHARASRSRLGLETRCAMSGVCATQDMAGITALPDQ